MTLALSPAADPGMGHLKRWTFDPLGLLDEGAALGAPTFRIRLWRSAIVGSSPAWNKFVLGDLDLFRSRGSLSSISPYLGAGIVTTDPPHHAAVRRGMAPHFRRTRVSGYGDDIAAVLRRHRPAATFDVGEWAADVVTDVLAAAFFGLPQAPAALRRFVHPLDQPLPAPFVPHPVRFARLDRVIAAAARRPGRHLFAQLPPARGRDHRVLLAAAYDTTVHTLTWMLGYLATHPQWHAAQHHERVIDETLRLRPAGWVGSRQASRDTSFGGQRIARGQLVMFSPYLTHRDPSLWRDPESFDPGRFDRDGIPAHGYLPFAAGPRICIGRFLAREVLSAALASFDGDRLAAVAFDPTPSASITLAPAHPVLVRREART